MVRPSGWDILGLDGDPTPGVVESVQDLAKRFGDFAHDVESAYRSLNSFGADANALEWVGQTAEAFKGQFGPLPGRLQKLYVSYSEASDALSAYVPKLQTAQAKADSALRQAQDANVDLQRATTSANSAAADLKTAQQNHAATPNPQAVTDAQTAHDTAQNNLKNAQAHINALKAQAHQAHDDLDSAAKDCAKALHHAQHDGIHNKHWWQHVGEAMSEWGGKIAEVAGEIAPVLDVLAIATSWIPGVDVVTAGLAEADNMVALFGSGMQIAGDTMQGHFGDALMGAGMLGAGFLGGKALSKLGGKALDGLASKFGKEAEEGAEGTVGAEALSAGGVSKCTNGVDPVDVISGQMITAETDLLLPGVFPAVLRRSYTSAYTTGRLFGPGWSSTLDQRLSINDAGIHYVGDDGQTLHYEPPAADEEVLPVRGDRWPLIWNREADEIRITDPWSGTTRHFPLVHYRDELGQIRDLAAITDRNGNRLSILRDDYGNPTGLEHPGYRIAVDTALTAAGTRVVGVRLLDDDTETSITIKQYRYDDRGRLTGVIDSTGTPYTYEWDEADRITAWIDRVGYRYAYEYGPDGRVVRGAGDDGFLSGTFEYRDDERVTVLTDSLGHSTTYRYDENGHINAVTDPLGGTVLTEYDRFGQLISRTDELGHRTAYDIDDRGDTVRGHRLDGLTTEADFNELHQITAMRLPDGTGWEREYDTRGNLASVVDATGAVTRYEYRRDGSPSACIGVQGAVTRYEVNRAGLPVVIIDPLGSVTRVGRDAFGRVVSVTDPLGRRMECAWTIEGKPLWRVEQDGARTQWAYDHGGRLISTTTPSGAVTAFQHGPFGTRVAQVESDGTTYQFGFNSETRPVTVTNEAGAVWHYDYDAAGRVVSETDFLGRHIAYEYDAASRLIARTNGIGERTSYEHDVNGLLTRRQTDDQTFSYAYDVMGRLTSASSPDSAISYTRDAAGRVLSETVNGHSTTYSYDPAGRRVGRVTPSGAVSTWSFDAAGRPITLDAGTNRMTFAFDSVGREVERTLGQQVRFARRSDSTGRLTGLRLWLGDGGRDGNGAAEEQLVFGRDWSYQPDGAPNEIRDSIEGSRRYTTDARGRVTAVTSAAWTETYAYDAFGNLSQARSTEDSDTSGLRETDRTLVRGAGRTTYEHDAAGRLIRTVRRTLDGRRRVWRFDWDAEDRIVRAAVPDGSTWHYAYDPLGRRTSKTRVSPNGDVSEETLFTWDASRLVEQLSTAPGTAVSALTWDYEPGSFTPATQRRRSWADDADQGQINEEFHAIISDLVGTPTELVSTDGRIAWRMTSSLWGEIIAVSATAGLDCPLRFAGQYHDDETGLHYNLYRYYDPGTASYLSPDPLGLQPAPNDHAYVLNPLIWADPLGLVPVECPTDVALGYKSANVEQWAADPSRNFTHYLGNEWKPQNMWEAKVAKAITNPNTTIHVYTEGFKEFGGFEEMAVRGLNRSDYGTDKEMGWIARAVMHKQTSWDDIKFYTKDGLIKIKEPDWTDEKWAKALIYGEL
jgi:RHS repeat-associated protein